MPVTQVILGETLSALSKSVMLMIVYMVAMGSGFVGSVEAQSPNPDITVTCIPGSIPIDVYPGATRLGATYCEAVNPTAYAEKVNIQITSAGLAYAAPGSITVPPQDSITFEVTIRGDDRMAEGSRQVTITARVDQFNGVPCGTCTSQSVNVMVVVKQFALLRVEAEEPFKQLRPKVDYILEFKVYNDGNNRDRFNIEVANRDVLEDGGFQISMPQISTEIESLAPPSKVRVLMRTPKKQGWSDHYYQLDFKATSDHSLRSSGTPMYQTQMVTLYIRGVYLPGFELFSTLMMVGLASTMVFKRRLESEGIPTDDLESPHEALF